MFGLFKKGIEKEFYKRMKQSSKSHAYIQRSNPFEVAPAVYNKHTEVLMENRKWLSENLDELKKVITEEQYEMVLDVIKS